MPNVKEDYYSGGKDTYNRFCKAHPEIKIDFKTWKSALEAFNTGFRDYTLNSAEKARFGQFGYFVISKKKARKLARFVNENGDVEEHVVLSVDWVKTKKAGKKIYRFNHHTNGYSFRWKWFQEGRRFYMGELWNFKPCRISSRKITEYVNRKDIDYCELYKHWERRH